MDGVFKKVNQNVNLGRYPTPDRPDIAISKDGFFKNLPKNCNFTNRTPSEIKL